MATLTDCPEATRLPAAVVAAVQALYDRVEGHPHRIGDTANVEDYVIETHTLGCRNAADDPEDTWYERHWEIYDEYSADGESILLGDPGDGIFVTITPLAPVKVPQVAAQPATSASRSPRPR